MQLRVSTYKGLRTIVTMCQAVKIENGIESFVIFQDFNKRLQVVEGRATEKNISIAHSKALENIETIIQEANKSYN